MAEAETVVGSNTSKADAALLTIALCLSTIAACDKDPIAGDDNTVDRTPVTLPVVGQGTITTRFTAEVAVHGDFAYTTTWSNRMAPGNAIHIWNVSGASPVFVDSVIVPNASTLGDVQISDDGALLVVATEYNNGSIILFDRSQPDNLVQLARYNSPATNHGVHTVKLGRVDGRHYAFLSIDPTPAQLVIVDITSPSSPAEVLVRPMGAPYVHDVFVRDGLLFTALWDEGLSIWDIGGGNRGGSPAEPVLISNIETVGGNAHNVWWYHDASGRKRYVFVGEEGPGSIGANSSGDIHVVDISDMTQPREVAFFTVAGAGTHNFTMDEENGILYAAYYNAGVRAIDVTGDMSSCDEDARDTMGRCNLTLAHRDAGFALTSGTPAVSIWGVALLGRYLFASDMLSGIFKIDVASLQ